MLKATLKRKWVKALLSGDYEQGRGKLRSKDDKFCCLGVLCDVLRNEGIGIWKKNAFHSGDGVASTHMLSTPLLKRIGLTTTREEKLVSLNDSQGKDFIDIAKYIKEKL